VSRLPPEPTRFVGRARDLERIEAALGESRLVTLCGPPGMGKTRTALQIARRRDGWFCDLSEARDLPALCAAVARGLDAALGDDAVTELGRRLASLGDALVVLDNFEQLVAHAPATLGRWLEMAPAARFLVASRERLRLREEAAFDLSPLEEGLELMLDRVRAHRPGYEPSAAERERLAELTRALEGIPLAIELAAARVPALGVEGLLRRLDQRLDFRGARGAPVRQATLRGAIDASWQQLDDGLRRALSRASVFHGGFAVDAAEAVIGDAALALVEDLVARSLVWVPSPGRFALYESIREFSAERLEERAETELLHRRYYLELGEREAEAFVSRGALVDRLVVERDNLLAAFEHAAAAGAFEDAARVVLALGPVLQTRGPARFHLELLDRVLGEVEGDARLHHARALVLRALGDVEHAEQELQHALELAPADAMVRKDLGLVYHQRRQLEPARACYDAALAAARASGHLRAEAIVVGNLGALAHDVGNFEEAAERYDQALGLFQRVGDVRGEGIFLTNMAVLEQEEGREVEARRHYEKALLLLEQSGDKRYQAIALGNLGVAEHEARDLGSARTHHERALALLREVGDVYSEALCRARLGAVLADLGELEASDRQLDDAERAIAGRDRLALEIVRLHRCFLDRARGEDAVAFRRIQLATVGEDLPPPEGGRVGEGGSPTLSEVSDDARLVLRMLSRSMRTGPRPRLEIGPEARWFRAHGGAKQLLDKHASARRIVDRLAREHEDRPGQALSAGELFEAGWPGVTIRAESAHNRLYVTLAKLRKMGLKLQLLRTDAGYLLDPATPVVRVAD
jgi:predicted ATPase